MSTRLVAALLVMLSLTAVASAQTTTRSPGASRTKNVWLTAGGTSGTASQRYADRTAAPPATLNDTAPRGDDRIAPSEQFSTGDRNMGDRSAAAPLSNVSGGPPKPIAKVRTGTATLPSDDGQVWREYDISPYTLRVASTNRPEQAIVDWVLRETGYEVWHSEPLGLLSADSRTLKVYHTPQMQALVTEVVDRFVNTEAESHAFGLRVVTIDDPNWRAVAHRMMRPVPVQTQGVQAWLLEKENAALLLAELRKRTDFREHSSPHLLVNNGQSTVVSLRRPISYIRDVILRPGTWPGFETEAAQIDEGFSLELNPLLSLDGNSIDAILKCNIDQVERLQEVNLEVPTAVAPRQRTKIEVPQASHCRLHERFHWPVDQVLLVGLGVVATPVPTERNPNLLAMALAMPQQAPRADLLVFIENKGKQSQATTATARTGRVDAQSYRGRY